MRPILIFLTLLLFATCVPQAHAQRAFSEETQVFRDVRDGVFTVYSEYGKGTGFLVSADGLVVTNAHVLSTSDRIRVVLDPGLKVEATIVHADEKKDLAILRVHTSFVHDRPVLALSDGADGYVEVGERVLAIGSPLNQDRVLTSGIVSKVEEGAIIADVNINPGSSGGPLLNLASDVVGINTFGDVAARGQGLAGSISVRELHRVLEKARTKLDTAEEPSTAKYPCMPDRAYPVRALQDAVTRFDYVSSFEEEEHVFGRPGRTKSDHARGASGAQPFRMELGGFEILVFTPPRLYYVVKRREIDRAERAGRRSEEAREDADVFGDLREWGQYAGGWTPTVMFVVMPKLGQTGSSVFGNIISGIASGITGISTGSHSELEFKGDVAEFDLYEDGEMVSDLQRGVTWIPLDFSTGGFYSASGKDLARMGVFQYSAEDFAVDENGLWPDIDVFVRSSDEDAPRRMTLPPGVVEAIHADFDEYRWSLQAAQAPLVVKGAN